MGIFSSIKEKLFGKAKEETAKPTTSEPAVTADAKPATTEASKTAADTTKPVAAGSADAAAGNPSKTTGTTGTPASAESVDVAAILDAAVKTKGQKLDWRHSIVDMMKALDLDSGLSARKELAAELHYSGDTEDSAKMNVWLHKALMKALAEHGGKVPAELLD